jgi:hypothetical protein
MSKWSTIFRIRNGTLASLLQRCLIRRNLAVQGHFLQAQLNRIHCIYIGLSYTELNSFAFCAAIQPEERNENHFE